MLNKKNKELLIVTWSMILFCASLLLLMGFMESSKDKRLHKTNLCLAQNHEGITKLYHDCIKWEWSQWTCKEMAQRNFKCIK